jgi:hypothetical protein
MTTFDVRYCKGVLNFGANGQAGRILGQVLLLPALNNARIKTGIQP